MTQEEFDNHPGWQFCTPQGARDQVLLLDIETTFREKLEWLEEAENFSMLFRFQDDAAVSQAESKTVLTQG